MEANSKNTTGRGTDWMTEILEPILLTSVSFGIFRALQFIVRWYLFGKWTFRTFNFYKFVRRRRSTNKPVPDITAIDIVPPNKRWRISNEVVSLIHSVISGLWSLYILMMLFDQFFDVHDRGNWGRGLVDVHHKIGIYLIYTTFGYLVHDFVDLVINENSARIIELLFHHVVVICAFLITIITYKFMGIVVIGLLMEVNSIFLHTRSLLNLYGIPKTSTAFKFVALLNIVTYLIFRMFVSLYLIYWWAISITLKLEWYLYVINAVVILSLFSTNSVLFYRVLGADGLLGKGRARQYGSARAPASGSVENGHPTTGEGNEAEAIETESYSSDDTDENTDLEAGRRNPGGPTTE